MELFTESARLEPVLRASSRRAVLDKYALLNGGREQPRADATVAASMHVTTPRRHMLCCLERGVRALDIGLIMSAAQATVIRNVRSDAERKEWA